MARELSKLNSKQVEAVTGSQCGPTLSRVRCAKMVPPMPTTAITELNLMELTPFAYYTVMLAIKAAASCSG
jgi:hypothetical protein